MRNLLAASLLLASVCTQAFAGSATLGAQYGVKAGSNQGSGQSACNGAPLPYVQCVNFVGSVVGFLGTQTVKMLGIELLANVVCNGQVIWAGEQFQGTHVIISPNLPNGIVGPCWIAWAADSTVNTADGAAWEMQFTIFYQ